MGLGPFEEIHREIVQRVTPMRVALQKISRDLQVAELEHDRRIRELADQHDRELRMAKQAHKARSRALTEAYRAFRSLWGF